MSDTSDYEYDIICDAKMTTWLGSREGVGVAHLREPKQKNDSFTNIINTQSDSTN